MGRGEGESCASYYILLWNVLIVFFSSSDFAELSDTFSLHGLRTEFKRKATYAVEGAETTFCKVTQISQMTQIQTCSVYGMTKILFSSSDFAELSEGKSASSAKSA